MHVLVNNNNPPPTPQKNPQKKPKTQRKKPQKPKTEQNSEKLRKNKILELKNKRDDFLFVRILDQIIGATCMQDL